MRLMAANAGLWLDTDVLLLKAVEIDPAKPYFAWEGRLQLGNSVPVRSRSDRHRLRVAIVGPAALTALARREGELGCALPKKTFYSAHASRNCSLSRAIFPR
jgi:hypothetical protein